MSTSNGKLNRAVRLSDSQVAMLSTAAQRADGAMAVPDRVKGAAAQKLIGALIGGGLAREVRAKAGMPVVRPDEDDGRAYALVITKQGKAAVSVVKESDGAKEPLAQTSAAPATEEKPPAAANLAVRSKRAVLTDPAIASTDGHATGTAQTTAQVGSVAPLGPNPPRAGSKLAEVIARLTRPDGALLNELVAATGWLPHTTRAALTGLRHRGYVISRSAGEQGESAYRIVGRAQPFVAVQDCDRPAVREFDRT